MSRRIALVASATLLAFSACKPIERPHTYDHQYPQQRMDFTMRWIGTASGVAVWGTTANDLEQNGRYEGVQFLIDPGTPTDVETTVLPYLAQNGVPAKSPVAYVVLTSVDAQTLAGAERVAKEFPGAEIVAAGALAKRPDAPKTKLSGVRTKLDLGPEVSARMLPGPGGTQAALLRFIDVAFLILPSTTDELLDEMAHEIGEQLEKEGLKVTAVAAANAKAIDPAKLEHLAPELVVGGTNPRVATIHLATPKAGDAVVVGTNGSEMRTGKRTRSRYAHWLDCEAATNCGVDLPLTGTGPIVVPVKLEGQDEGQFLVDTRAPFSYLTRKRYEKIPGWENAEGAGHSHAGGQIGLEVPAFTLGSGARSVRVHRWHVLPIDPFQIGGKDIAGVIGMDLLQSFKVDLLPKEKRLSWTPNFEAPRENLGKAESKLDGARETYDVPMDRSPGGPLILATMDGEVKSLVVDLAAERTRVYVRAEAWNKVASPAKQELWMFDVPDEIDDAKWKKWELTAGVLTVKELNLFGAKFSDQPALAVDRPLDVDVIGLDFLRTFDRVSLDFRRRSIVLERG